MFFNDKSSHQSSSVVHCPCKNEQGIFITHRHATWIVSLAIIWSFFIFISGYFLGQRVVLEQFTTRLEQDSLSDKIYSSLCTLYEVDNEGEVTDNDADLSVADTSAADTSAADTSGTETTIADTSVANTGIERQKLLVADGAKEQSSQKEERKNGEEKKIRTYYAPLAGFGSAERAYAFAKRCTDRNVKVVVKKKPSKSIKGRTHYWYQVVTQPYEDKKMLIAAVDTIKRTEHIRTISIQEL
jgi:hypothetical protein